MEDLPVVASGPRFAGLALLVLVVLSVPSAVAFTEDEVRTDLARAYEAVARADAAGGDIHKLVNMLDDATRMIPGASQSLLEAAKGMINIVLSEAPLMEAQGVQRVMNRLYVVIAVIAIIGVLVLAILSRGSRWFWGAWLRMHRGWKVERT